MRWEHGVHTMVGQMYVDEWFNDVNVCKEQRWAPNIHSEEFQHVGRTIFIKSKNASFSLYYNSNPDFQNFDFLKVIIRLSSDDTKLTSLPKRQKRNGQRHF